jgi:CHAT domain-containing protein
MRLPAVRRRAALVFALAAACGPPAASRPVADAAPSSDSLLAQGERFYLRGAFDTARGLWSDALSRSRQAHDSLGEARALTWLGLAAWRQGDYPAARRLGESALALKRQVARDADLFKSYNALGLLAWNEGRFADATRLFGEASAAARAAGDLKSIASASGNLALVQTELGDFDDARRGFDSMRVAGRALSDRRIEGNALTNLGMLAVRVGDPAAAIPLLDSARARYRAAAYPTGEQNALGQLGTAYAALGQPSLALAVLDSALELSRRQGLRQDEASNLEAMAELYRSAGDVTRALALYARAEPIDRELGLTVEAGANLRSVADIHAELGALDRAREAGARALAVHRSVQAKNEQLTDLLLLADVADRAGQRSEAVGHLAAAEALARALGTPYTLAQVALAEARLADRAHRPAAALGVLGRAGKVLAGAGYGIEQEALGLEARSLARLGRLDSAAAVGRRAVAAVERVRGGFESGELRVRYLAGRGVAYADLADILRRLGRTEEAFEVSDASRGRALLERLANARRDSAVVGGAGRALREADALLRTIGALNELLRAAQAEAGDAPDSSAQARVRFLAGRLAGARGDYEELAVRLQEISTPAVTLLGGGRPRTAIVLAGLRADEAVLEYQPIADSLLIFIGRRARLRVVAIPLPHGGLESRVRLARELIAVRNDTAGRARLVLQSLGDLLIRPARRAGALTGVRDLIIVPHGALAYLPFAALIDSATGRYLVQDFGLLTLPSAASLAALRTRGARPAYAARPAVFAPDPAGLPGTGVEASVVGGALTGAIVHLGRAASEPAAREALASGAIVHLAAHGELNARNPMFSWLATAPGGPGDPAADGRLEVHEILGLTVRSPLVFLSACETGLGTAGSTGFAQGEDFATLARAFLYAGARNVVATLWRVDDQGAATFAAEYYRRLAAEGPVGALVGAQRTMLADPRFGGPYYWAGYTLAGDGRMAGKRQELSIDR